jgi:hypothetical protein
MSRTAFLGFVVILLCGTITNAQDDEIKAKLTAAKHDFETESAAAHDALAALLKDKEAEAQKAGNLPLTERIRAEETTFDSNDELPKSVSTRAYKESINKARLKLEDAYTTARKAYTQAGQIDDAKSVDKELVEFKTTNQVETKVEPKSDENASIDLLKMVDPTLDAIRGKWRKDGESLISPSPYVDEGRLSIPIWPAGDYDLILKFTRLEGPNGPGISLPVGNRQVNLVVDADGKRTALQMVDGKFNTDPKNPTLDLGHFIEDNKEYTLEAHVSTLDNEPARVQIDLDGKRLIDWTGKPSQLSFDPNWNLKNNHVFGLHAWGSVFRFDSIQLRMLSGEAKRP